MADITAAESRYRRIVDYIFAKYYRSDTSAFDFNREDIIEACDALGFERIKNLGDLIYNSRYRSLLPENIKAIAPEDKMWVIRPVPRARYRFALWRKVELSPRMGLAVTRIPDATPVIVDLYASRDEQGLLAKLRYNRLIDVFTGVTCYSLQSHLRTTILENVQVETDELYVGIDHQGVQYIFPVQAKGERERMGVVQIWQDATLCQERYPALHCRPIGTRFLSNNQIALMEFAVDESGVSVVQERHYRLTPKQDM
jgi:hypothetical protein